MDVVMLPNKSFFAVKEFKNLEVLKAVVSENENTACKDRVRIDISHGYHFFEFESSEKANEFADFIHSEIVRLDVEADELYRIAVGDKLKVKFAEIELDIEKDKVKELVNKNIFLKHLISEANNTFFIGKPKIEVPLNY